MTRKEEIEQAAHKYIQSDIVSPENMQLAFGDFINGAEWADHTMLDKVCEFIKTNAYKYGKVKFIDSKASFDFRTDTFINDLRKAMEE